MHGQNHIKFAYNNTSIYTFSCGR